jgi:hypothetical protein
MIGKRKVDNCGNSRDFLQSPVVKIKKFLQIRVARVEKFRQFGKIFYNSFFYPCSSQRVKTFLKTEILELDRLGIPIEREIFGKNIWN